MKAETLKKSILQYAMQGKLVEQNPDDEPASELLKRIKAEKEQLIKDGKIKKEKPLPPITEDEIPFELPRGWEWVRLGNVINITSGKFLPSSAMKTEGTIPVYGGNGINGHHNEYLIDKPTLIIGRVGFYCGCVHLSTGKAWVTDNAFIVSFSENNININFLKWLLIQAELGNNDNATAQPVVSGKKIYPLLIALPPLTEQQRIVEKLEQILPLVKEYGKNEEKLSELNKTLPDKIKQSILQHAVQGKLVVQNPKDEPASELLKHIKAEKDQLIKDGKIKKEKPLPPITQDEIPYDLPQGWQWVRMQEVYDVRDGTHDSPKNVTNGIPLITSKDFKNGKINFDNAKLISADDHQKIEQRSHVDDGDILYSMIGGNIGNMVIVKKERDFSIKNVALFKYYDKKLSEPYFLKLLLEAITFDFKNKAFGGAQQFVSLNFIRNYLIPLPPLAEQKRIVAKVEELLNLVNKL